MRRALKFLSVDLVGCICAALFAVAMLLLMGVIAGCAAPAHLPKDPPNSIPVAASSVDKAKGHVESADNLVNKAKPEANKTGQALLGAASDEHTQAVKDLDAAKKELTQAQAERDKVRAQVADEVKQLESTQAALAKVKSGWGYRLQVFVASIFWTIVLVTVLHFALGIAGVFVAGPVGILLGRIGGVLNPFAWFQFFRDHLHFERNCPGTEPAKPAVV